MLEEGRRNEFGREDWVGWKNWKDEEVLIGNVLADLRTPLSAR
jgi:hypothetical protein